MGTLASPSAVAAINRHRAFEQKIAAAAARLRSSKMSEAVQALGQPVGVPEALAPDIVDLSARRAELTEELRRIDAQLEATICPYPSVEQIQRAVARYYGVTRMDIRSSRRSSREVRPRQIAAYLAHELTPHSYPLLGKLFGGRDHTTILHAYRKIARKIREDEDTAFEVAMLFQEITGIQQ